MRILSKTEPRPAGADLTARPELWVPANLEAEFKNIPQEWRDSITPITNSGWLDTLRGDDRKNLNGKRGGLLHDHLTAALAALHYDGIVPGIVPRPSVFARHVEEPITLLNGTKSSLLSQLVPADPTDEDRAAKDRWRRSEEQRDEFQELLTQTVTGVLADTTRSWEAYVHITLLDRVRTDIAQRQDEAQREAQRRRVMLCPVCKEENGNLAWRPLAPNHDETKHNHSTRPKVYSCIPCWHEGVRLHLESRAQLPDGRTRAEAVAAALQQTDHLTARTG